MIKKYIGLMVLIIFFQGCGKNDFTLKNLVTTENAIQMKKNYKEIVTLLIKYKTKLDKRNPKLFNKDLEKSIIKDMKNSADISYNNFKDNEKNNYNVYLKNAFNQHKNIINRNDMLILGLYKLLYLSYGVKNEKLTALSYNLKNLQEFNKVIQIVRWKIKYDKDKANNYLFLTWQNNWQVELHQRIDMANPDYNLIKDLKYIKNKEENVFLASNMSFDNIISKILYINNNSIKRLGGEPDELTIGFIKFFVFL